MFPAPVLVQTQVAAVAPADPILALELKYRVKHDQDFRNGFTKFLTTKAATPQEEAERRAFFEKGRTIDAGNTARMEEIIAHYGWPGKTLVGAAGAHNAWLLVQHADQNRPFQKKCLELMAPLVEKGEVSPSDFAYLTDRVLVGENKPQRYGTQGKQTESGLWEPDPMEDPANIDVRRKAVGLSTLAEYKRMINEFYGFKAKNPATKSKL